MRYVKREHIDIKRGPLEDGWPSEPPHVAWNGGNSVVKKGVTNNKAESPANPQGLLRAMVRKPSKIKSSKSNLPTKYIKNNK